jgi:hypothetical protein
MKHPTIKVGGRTLSEADAGLLVTGLALIVRAKGREGDANRAARLMGRMVAKPKPVPMKRVRNLMSGKEIEIAADTPLSCDPSSETYWSM